MQLKTTDLSLMRFFLNVKFIPRIVSITSYLIGILQNIMLYQFLTFPYVILTNLFLTSKIANNYNILLKENMSPSCDSISVWLTDDICKNDILPWINDHYPYHVIIIIVILLDNYRFFKSRTDHLFIASDVTSASEHLFFSRE